MRILVTGAAGFIGSHAVDVMRAAGHEVQGLDSLTPAVHSGRPDYLPDNFDLAVGDVRDPDAVRRMKASADRDISIGGPQLAAAAFQASAVSCA